MEKKPPKPMTPFDEMVTPPHLQMLKLFLPYTPASNQQFLGIFIKFMEFQQTISFFQNSSSPLHSQTFGKDPAESPSDMLQDLKPYLPPQASEMMDTFTNMMSMMEMMQMMQENMPEQENASPDGSGNFSDGDSNQGSRPGEDSAQAGNASFGGFNPMDMMMGMMTPEQQNMFQMYNTMFSGEPDMNNMEGDDTDERMDEPPGDEES